MARTTHVLAVSFLCSLLLVQTPLPREVFAVEAAPASTEDVGSTSAEIGVDASSVAEEVPTVQPWYQSEQIFGDIDVGDFVVGPGLVEVEVAPGQTVVEEITITNRIREGTRFTLEMEDMVGSQDGSQAVVLTGNTNSPFTIDAFITFPEDEIELALGERAKIPVRITVPPNTSPGGYYGSILVSTVRTDNGERSATPIIARVGSLFFITVPGEVERSGETLEIDTVDQKWWYESGPIEMAVLFENTGSVHLNPYGELSITNMLGEQVGFVELDPWFALPRSLRTREIAWNQEFLFGRYTVTAKVNRGYDDIVDEVWLSFWVLPWKIVLGVFVVLFIVIFSIRAFFRTFEFKRKT